MVFKTQSNDPELSTKYYEFDFSLTFIEPFLTHLSDFQYFPSSTFPIYQISKSNFL